MPVKTAKAAPKFKTYISDFTIRFDPLSIQGKMIGVRKSDSETKVAFKLVSPEGNPVEQFYRDTETKELFSNDQCSRMAESGDEVVILDKATVDALKATPLPGNVVSLSVHPSEDVNKTIFTDKSNGYIFVPHTKDPKNVKIAKALTAAINASPDKAFLGVCNFHGYEGLFRATIWRGHLVFQKQSYPGDINDHEIQDLTMDNEAKVFKSFFDKKLEPFDAETYRNVNTKRLRDALADPSSIEDAAKADVPTDDDITSLLASLDKWGEG